MKKLWIIWCLLIAFAACSDDNNTTDDRNPFSPLTGLNIPVRVNVGTEIRIQGEGFAPDCEIWLQLNGGDKIQATVLKVEETGIVFTVKEAGSGFYAVILVQGGKEYRIGGINLVANELDPGSIEAYAVRGEMAPVVYPVSVSGKTVGQPLFEMRSGYYFGNVVSAADGKVYYAGFDSRYDETTHMIKMVYYIDFYDLGTGEKGSVPYERVNEFFAMGLIGGELHVLCTSDQQNFDLIKLAADGQGTVIRTYNLGALAGKIWSEDLGFVYDAGRDVIYLNAYLKGATPDGKAYVLDLNTGDAKVVDGGTKRFSTVMAENEVYYFCRESTDEEQENFITTVYRPADPLNWGVNDVSAVVATLENVSFSSPFYNTAKHVFYGIGDEEVVYTWDPAAPTAKPAQWVKTGCEYLFQINNNNN